MKQCVKFVSQFLIRNVLHFYDLLLICAESTGIRILVLHVFTKCVVITFSWESGFCAAKSPAITEVRDTCKEDGALSQTMTHF